VWNRRNIAVSLQFGIKSSEQRASTTEPQHPNNAQPTQHTKHQTHRLSVEFAFLRFCILASIQNVEVFMIFGF
jgi:hypothetical protein